MQSLIIMRTFFALNRQQPFEPLPGTSGVIDPEAPDLQADLAANGVTFEQFANSLVEQGFAVWSDEQ